MSSTTSSPRHTDNATDERREAAKRYAEQLRGFSGHVGSFATGMVIMFAVNLVTNISAGTAGDWNAWWSVWALLGWGIGIAVHGFVVWLNHPTFTTAAWEQRRIDRMLGE